MPSLSHSSPGHRLRIVAMIFLVLGLIALTGCDINTNDLFGAATTPVTTTPPAVALSPSVATATSAPPSATPSATAASAATATQAPRPTSSPASTIAATAAPTATQAPRSLAGLVAFASDRFERFELYLLDIERNDVVQWTSDGVMKRSPAWAPDGRTLAYGAHRDGSWQIFKRSVSGGRELKLTAPPGESFEPTWSPDGKLIAFTSNRDGREQVYLMDADGKNVRNLSRNTATDWQPTWSPDGRYLAFSSNRDGNWEIYVANADGSNLRNLTRSYGGDWSPAWSPDGSRIAFVSDRDGNPEIYVLRASDGGGATNLTKSVGADQQPVWSADGQRLIFVSKRDGNFELYLMNADGTNPKRLTTDGGDDIQPAWRWEPGTLASARVPTITLPTTNTIDAGPKLSTMWHFDGNPRIDGMRSSAIYTLAQIESAYFTPGGYVLGFEPGDVYPQIYIRDSSWMSIAAMYFYPPQYVRETVEEFLRRQYTERTAIRPNANVFPGDGAISGLFSPEITYDKHTTTTDEETNLIRAAYVYYAMSNDVNWLKKDINGQTVIARLNRAMEWVFRFRIEPSTSLVWRGHTTDWGDVKSEKGGEPTELGPNDARTASIFDQAMAYQALLNLAEMNKAVGNRDAYDRYRNAASDLKSQVEKWLWQPTKGFYRTHYHLTPLQHVGFDEDNIISIANALVVYTGLTERIEPLDRLEAATKTVGAIKPGLSLFPPYPAGVFNYPQMAEGQYQNGGLWDWWGGTQITAEFERGLRRRAIQHLNQVADDWAKNPRDIYEWQIARTGVRRGSNYYGGSVATMTEAVIRGLYGIRMDAQDTSVSPRLGEFNGWIRAHVPANGNFIAYNYQANATTIRIQYETNVSARELPWRVTMPPGLLPKRVTVDGQVVPFQGDKINEDDMASFVGTTGTHTIEITIGR